MTECVRPTPGEPPGRTKAEAPSLSCHPLPRPHAQMHSRVPPECRSLASCLPSLFALNSCLALPCREWSNLLRLQWHTKGEIGSCVPCLVLAGAEARDLMPDRVTLLVTLTIKCLPARRLLSCTHPSPRSHDRGQSAVHYRSALGGLGWWMANPLVARGSSCVRHISRDIGSLALVLRPSTSVCPACWRPAHHPSAGRRQGHCEQADVKALRGPDEGP